MVISKAVLDKICQVGLDKIEVVNPLEIKAKFERQGDAWRVEVPELGNFVTTAWIRPPSKSRTWLAPLPARNAATSSSKLKRLCLASFVILKQLKKSHVKLYVYKKKHQARFAMWFPECATRV
jgi:hypothetical protein